MAGDWIKMRVDLATDPAVIGMAFALECEEDLIVGKLHKLWSWANQQTADGNAPSVTKKWIDRYVCVTNFASALEDAGWLVVTGAGVQIPKFDRHNGKSGKQRALTARRVARKRNAPSVTKSLPEKRREEKTIKTKTKGVVQKGDKIPEHLKAIWPEWVQSRKDQKKPLTPLAVTRQLKKLATLPHAEQIEIIEYSIMNSYQGLIFDRRKGTHGRGANSSHGLGKVSQQTEKFDSPEADAGAAF
jgi:hypothetical protein